MIETHCDALNREGEFTRPIRSLIDLARQPLMRVGGLDRGCYTRAVKHLRFLPIGLLLIACGADPAVTPSDSSDHPSDGQVASDGADADHDVSTSDGHVAQEDSASTGAGDVPVEEVLPGTRFGLNGEGTHFILTHDGVPRLVLPLGAMTLGSVPAIDDTLNYDPYYLEPGDDFAAFYGPPEGLAWHAVTQASTVGSGDEATDYLLTLTDGRQAGLSVTHPGAGRVRLHWTPPTDGAPVVFFRFSPTIDSDEGLYGLGEVFDHVNHRGRVRAMQIELAELESGYNEVHVPVPLLTGTTGWGVFVESMRPGVFACATDSEDTVRVTFGLREAGPEGLVVHLFSADHPLDIVGRYYDVTGRPGPIGEWAMGPWIWRDEVDGQAAVEADLVTIRELDLATTGYWIDRPFASAVNSFDFEPSAYDDPAAMMAVADRAGFAMALWHTPYTDPNDPDSAPLHAEAEAQGYFAPLGTTSLAKWGPPLDFTNPDAVAWWRGLLTAYSDLGVVGYKLDYAEEVVVGGVGNRLPWLFHDGSNELTMHRGYQLAYHAAYAAMLPETGGFLLCRAGTYGDQTFGAIIWPGDIDATLSLHGEVVVKGDTTYVSVGGLHAAVVAGSSLGASGFPFFGSDTGGYRNAPPDRETYIRWFQHTALSPIMQVGTNANDLPWAFGAAQVLDQEMLDLYRSFARLHLRLHPYMWTYVLELQTTGRALQRPLGLAHPELAWHGDDIYMLGDHLIVAPVTRAGVVTREIPLPAGDWVDWWTGEVIQGGATVTRPAPLETLPLLVRAGALIPLLRPDVDTLLAVTGEFSDAIAVTPGDAGTLHVQVTRGPASTFTLHDGTVVSQTPTVDGLTLERIRGARFVGALVFEVIGVPVEPVSVTVGAWNWTEQTGGTVTITLTEDDLTTALIF
jgi:alpha-D-xyloside xylohydrolase